MDLLRFVTAGNVDDGKSTLIGRLLNDTHSILEDQLEAIREASARRGHADVDLALLTDGLKSEREQGITIDVAYRYFATARRKFIIADCPGHFQYTRNMVTGASNADAALILVDARKGLVEQTRRHCFVSSLLRIPHLIICVNKMDLVNYDRERFEAIRSEFDAFSKKLDVHDVSFIPMSPLNGDNIAHTSNRMPWYGGATLLHHLEEIHLASDRNYIDFRFPVQWRIFSQSGSGSEYRGYCGSIVSGEIKKGEEVMALPSGFLTRIKGIDIAGTEVDQASAPLSVTLRLEQELDLSRGEMLVRPNNQPHQIQDVEAVLCWMDNEPFSPAKKYILRHTTAECLALIQSVDYKFDINTLSRSSDTHIRLNDFARIKMRLSQRIFCDPYRLNRGTGSIILIDEQSLNTAAAGMII